MVRLLGGAGSVRSASSETKLGEPFQPERQSQAKIDQRDLNAARLKLRERTICLANHHPPNTQPRGNCPLGHFDRNAG